MATPRSVRVDPNIWNQAAERIATLANPTKITLTLRPGDTRNGAIEAFLRALLDATERRPADQARASTSAGASDRR